MGAATPWLITITYRNLGPAAAVGTITLEANAPAGTALIAGAQGAIDWACASFTSCHVGRFGFGLDRGDSAGQVRADAVQVSGKLTDLLCS